MAKEQFIRNKPHVNIGTLDFGQTLVDTAGQLSYLDEEDTSDPNRTPSIQVGFAAPGSLSSESAVVAFPIDTDFLFDPAPNGPALSIDFDLEVLPQNILGSSQIDVSLAIVQGDSYVATSSAGSLDGTETDWTILSLRNLQASDFRVVGGGSQRPDFSRPFQFGYSFSGDYSTTALDVDLLLDNMTVEVTTVPEPTSIGLALSLGAAYVWHRWFRRDD